jgi:hypothetical protein
MLSIQVFSEGVKARVEERFEFIDPVHHLAQGPRMKAVDPLSSVSPV